MYNKLVELTVLRLQILMEVLVVMKKQVNDTKVVSEAVVHRKATLKKAWGYRQMYLLLLPALLYVLIFNYQPMYGVIIAFKKFSPLKGIWGSPWVGLEHFQRYVESPMFLQILKNTLSLSVYNLVAGFPLPIVLALALHYTNNQKFKRFVQTVTYAPHFLSTVIVCSMIIMFLSPRSGIINSLLEALGFERVFFMSIPSAFKHIYVWSGIWQGIGWSSIIYMAALAGIDSSIHESAMLDGASRLQRIWHIDIPGILPTIVTLLILNTGSLMGSSFEKIYLLQNSLNQSASEVIATFVYKRGILGGEFSFSTAVGLFNSIINLILMSSVNFISKKVTEVGLW